MKDSKLIYPVESGLVPHYTGHIPGLYFFTRDIFDKFRILPSADGGGFGSQW